VEERIAKVKPLMLPGVELRTFLLSSGSVQAVNILLEILDML